MLSTAQRRSSRYSQDGNVTAAAFRLALRTAAGAHRCPAARPGSPTRTQAAATPALPGAPGAPKPAGGVGKRRGRTRERADAGRAERARAAGHQRRQPPDARPVTFLVAPVHTLLLFLLILLLLREGHGIFDEAQVSHGEAVGPLGALACGACASARLALRSARGSARGGARGGGSARASGSAPASGSARV